MMKCPKCGRTDHEPGAKFCYKDGTKLINNNESPIQIVELPKPHPSYVPGREAIESPIHIVEHPKPRPVDAPGREAIDLGLPSGTKWASCNVGATRSEEYGGYYAWGETEERKMYDWNSYIHCDGSVNTCHKLGNDISGTQYDVAHVQWGDNWRMPTHDQIKELLDNCSSEWTSLNGVKGRQFIGPHGRSIFLPAAGVRWGNGLHNTGSPGYYWSSTPYPSYSYGAYGLYFDSDLTKRSDYGRCNGHNVRPVFVTQSSSYMKSRGGDVFNEMPGGYILKEKSSK